MVATNNYVKRLEELFLNFNLYECEYDSFDNTYYELNIKQPEDVKSRLITTDNPNYIEYLLKTFSINVIKNKKFYIDKLYLLNLFRQLNLNKKDFFNGDKKLEKLLGFEFISLASENSILNEINKNCKTYRINELLYLSLNELIYPLYNKFIYELNKYECINGYIHGVNDNLIKLYDDTFSNINKYKRNFYRDIIIYGCAVWRR